MSTAATVPAEAMVIGSLLEDCPADLPPKTSRLLANAPQSFADSRMGVIGATIREMRLDGVPVSILTVGERLTARQTLDAAGGGLMLDEVFQQAVGPNIMEHEAGAVLDAFEHRRLKSILSDGLSSMESKPEAHKTIADGIRQALDAGRNDAAGFSIRAPDEILAMQFDESDRILGDHMLDAGQPLAIVGPSGAGKTRLLHQLAVSCVGNRQFLDFETRGQGLSWLIIQGENSCRRLQHDLARLRDWVGDKAWFIANERLRIHTLETDGDGFLNLENPENLNQIARAIKEFKPDVVAFDSLNNFTDGDLNKDCDMRATLTAMSRLVKAGNPNRAIVVLHHALTGKAGASRATGFDRASYGRNSKSLHGWARAQVNVAPGSADDNDTLVLSCGKCSNGKEFAPFAIKLNPESLIYEVDQNFDMGAWVQEVSGTKTSEPLMRPERVRELCRMPMSKLELSKLIMGDCGCYRGSAYRYITRAEQARKIRFNKDHETYCPT